MTPLKKLVNLTRLFRTYPVLAHFLLPLLLAVAVCGAGLGWLGERDARAKNDAEHARALELAEANIESISRAYLRASDSLATVGDGLTVVREHYSTLRDTILVDLDQARVHSDSPTLAAHNKLLRDLPVFLRSGDSAMARCTQYQESCESFHRTADSLIAALRYKNDLLEHASVWKPPRWTMEGETLFDPIAVTPAATGAVTFRVAGGVSLVVRGEQRFAEGEHPRLYVGLRVTR